MSNSIVCMLVNTNSNCGSFLKFEGYTRPNFLAEQNKSSSALITLRDNFSCPPSLDWQVVCLLVNTNSNGSSFLKFEGDMRPNLLAEQNKGTYFYQQDL